MNIPLNKPYILNFFRWLTLEFQYVQQTFVFRKQALEVDIRKALGS